MNIAKDVAALLLRSFGFVAVFWLSWIFVFRPISMSYTQSSVVSNIEERQQAETYAQQLQKANEQLAVIDSQQKRMDALLSQYEQQVKRYEAVLQKWEQQTGLQR